MKLRIEEVEVYPWYVEVEYGAPADFAIEVSDEFYERFAQLQEDAEEISNEIIRLRVQQLGDGVL